MSNSGCRGAATLSRVVLLCGLVALAGCSQGDHSTSIVPVACDPPSLGDFAGTWRFTLPSTVTGSVFTHCTDPALDGTPFIVPTEAPCPADPTSPCPVALTFPITLYLKEYHPGGEPLYGISGATGAGQVLFGSFRSGACTTGFAISGGSGFAFGCEATFSDSHREMFGSCAQGTPPGAGQGQGWSCEIAPPIEPLVEFLPSGPGT